MEENSRKRVRKEKLEPRSYDLTENEANDLQLQMNQSEMERAIMSINSLNEEPDYAIKDRPNLLEFSVRVEVEEFEEATDNNPCGSGKKRRISKKKLTKNIQTDEKKVGLDPQCTYIFHQNDILEELNKMKVNNSVDKFLNIAARNYLGKILQINTWSDYPNEELLQETFFKWRTWLKHSKQRGQPLSYKCYVCNKAWWYLSCFKDHIRQHKETTFQIELELEERQFECNIIAFSDQVPVPRDIHIDGNCWRCGHSSEKHPFSNSKVENYYTCNFCFTHFSNTCVTLKNHETMCYGRPYYYERDNYIKCLLCSYYFMEKDMETHFSFAHCVRSDNPINTVAEKCKFCKAPYYLYTMHRCPAKTMNVICNSCNMRFASKQHVQIHKTCGRTDVPCDACNHVARHECMLPFHYVEHTKNYKMTHRCTICSGFTVFLNVDAASIHMLQCHNLKYRGNQTFTDMLIVPINCFKKTNGIKNITDDTIEDTITIEDSDDDEGTYVIDESKEVVDESTEVIDASTEVKEDNTMNTSIVDSDEEHDGYALMLSKVLNISNEEDQEPEDLEDDIIQLNADIDIEIRNTSFLRSLTSGQNVDIVKSEVSEEADIVKYVHEDTDEVLEACDIIKKEVVDDDLVIVEPGIISESDIESLKQPLENIDEKLPTKNIKIENEGEPDVMFDISKVKTEIEVFELPKITGCKSIKVKSEPIYEVIDENCIDLHSVNNKDTKSETNTNIVIENIKQESVTDNNKDTSNDETVKVKTEPLTVTEQANSLNKTKQHQVKLEKLTEPIIIDDDTSESLVDIVASEVDASDLLDQDYDQNDDDDLPLRTAFKCRRLYRCRCGYENFHKQYRRHFAICGKVKSKRNNNVSKKKQIVKNTKCDNKSSYFQRIAADVTCTICNKMFKHLKKYMQHMSLHNFVPLHCPVCNKSFNVWSSMMPHYCTHINANYVRMNLIQSDCDQQKSFICIQCKECVDKEDFFSHWERHFAEKTNKGVKEHSQDLMVVEQNVVCNEISTGDVKINSEYVVIDENTVISVIRLLQGTNIKIRQCIVCLRNFNRRNDIKRHLIEHLLTHAYHIRPHPNLLKCQICDDKFYKADQYRYHMRSHGALPVYKCELCGKYFSDSSNFTKHKKLHSLQVLICEICKKKFQAKFSLIKHMELHRKNEPIKCKMCPKVFYTASMYKKHMKVSHEKHHSYKCHICREPFSSLKLKWDHLWTVHNERQILADCHICMKSFRKYIDVRNHIKDEHSEVQKEQMKYLIKLRDSMKLSNMQWHKLMKGSNEKLKVKSTNSTSKTELNSSSDSTLESEAHTDVDSTLESIKKEARVDLNCVKTESMSCVKIESMSCVKTESTSCVIDPEIIIKEEDIEIG